MEKTEVSTKQIVSGAIDVLAQYNWIRGTMAVNAKGLKVGPSSPGAVSFCVLGALDRALWDAEVRADSERAPAWNGIHRACLSALNARGYRSKCVSEWNDHDCAGKDDAIALLREASELL